MFAANQPRDAMTSKKPNTQRYLAGLTLTAGLLLMAYMIRVEDEPGALPLALILAGTAWLLTTRRHDNS